jgi:hypothetical protein
MKTRTIILILIAVFAGLIIAAIAYAFEIRTLPDYSWRDKYEFESKEPYGLWLFSDLLKSTYGVDNVIINESDTLPLLDGNNNLYIAAGQYINYSDEQIKEIIEFTKRGNSALMLADICNMGIPLDSFYLSDKYKSDDEEAEELDIEGYDNYNQDYYDTDIDSLWRLKTNSFADSIFRFSHTPFDSIYSDYEYWNYHRIFDKPQVSSFNYFYEYQTTGKRAESVSFENILYTEDDRSFFVSAQVGEGTLYFHSAPILLTNIGSRQDYYRDHINTVFSSMYAEKVILDKPKFKFNFNEELAKNPIAFILKTPSLAWAYYLMIASLITFVVFRSKRQQRIIPQIERKENTSKQYIKTISTLYQSQKQNNKLVLHMKEIFFNKIKSKYFISKEAEDFEKQLNKKSKVPEKEIKILLHKFDSALFSDFTDEQLMVLHNQIESFHKKSK